MKQMTEYQRELVTQNMDLVDTVIRCRIGITGGPLLTYEDFYAIGCEALCHAAMCYKPKVGSFAPLAKRHIYNAMIDHCRKEHPTAAVRCDFDLYAECNQKAIIDAPRHLSLDEDLYNKSVGEVFQLCKTRYTGIALKGIEAIELKSLGFSTTEIAERYGTTVNNINAWISRARSKLRQEPEFLRLEF